MLSLGKELTHLVGGVGPVGAAPWALLGAVPQGKGGCMILIMNPLNAHPKN